MCRLNLVNILSFFLLAQICTCKVNSLNFNETNRENFSLTSCGWCREATVSYIKLVMDATSVPVLEPAPMWTYPTTKYCEQQLHDFLRLNNNQGGSVFIDFSSSTDKSFEISLMFGQHAAIFFYDTGCEVTLLSSETASNPAYGDQLLCHPQLITRLVTASNNAGHYVFTCLTTVRTEGVIVEMAVNAPSFSDLTLGNVQLLGWNFIKAVNPCIDHRHHHFLMLGGKYTATSHLLKVTKRMKLLGLSVADLKPYSSLPPSATVAAEEMMRAGLSSLIMRVSLGKVSALFV